MILETKICSPVRHTSGQICLQTIFFPSQKNEKCMPSLRVNQTLSWAGYRSLWSIKKDQVIFFAVHNKDVFMTFWNVSSHAILVFLVETVICSATDSMTATREKKKCSLLRRLIYIIAFIFQWQSSCMLWLESSTLFVSKLQIFCAHLIAK